ncbi:MAG: FHA domain-containing protein [Planctomycetaceae bacterium]|nr:FHA domain-containing protein [Planctomycetaceae bacterium]
MYGELNPLGGGDPIPLKKQKLLVGRRPTCDLCLPFPNVSSQHCELEMKNGYWHIQDLGSSNGLKVNGARVESKFLLPGDELTIAKHRFAIQYEPLSDAPPPEDDNPFSLSLMEKAGLVNKRRKKKADSSHEEDLLGDASKAKIAPRPKSTGNQQEDQIMQWLSED